MTFPLLFSRWLLGATALLAGTVCFAAAEVADPPKEIVFKRVGERSLKAYLFAPAPSATAAKKPAAAVIFFFAGGWKTGDPSQLFEQAKYLSARGLVGISADYRTESKDKTSPREAVQDAKSCLRYFRAHAAEYGIDPQRIVAAGGSSGGHLAAACAFITAFNEPNEDASVSCRPDAVALFNAVIDNGPRAEGGYGYDRVKDYVKEISPIEHITDGGPPTLFMIGTSDRLIPLTTALKFQAAMQQHHNRCDLMLYGGQDHGFFQFKKNDHAYFYQTMAAMDAFLVSLGYLEHP